MAGNERFARRSEELGLPLFRHVYGQDVVPHLPPRDVDPEYRHFGSRYAADRGRSRWAREDGTADQAELADIAPALLTLLTVRMPTLEGRHPLELLRVLLEPFVPCVNRVPPLKVISRMLGWVLSNCSWAPKYSVDDHVPTHYVDVCGGSLERPHVELVR